MAGHRPLMLKTENDLKGSITGSALEETEAAVDGRDMLALLIGASGLA